MYMGMDSGTVASMMDDAGAEDDLCGHERGGAAAGQEEGDGFVSQQSDAAAR
jgi:hypothetical protein